MNPGLALFSAKRISARRAQLLILFFFAAYCKSPEKPAGPIPVDLIGQDLPAPKGNHTFLFINSGRKIALDSVANGMIPGFPIEKIGDGIISFEFPKNADINISNPRGSRALQINFGDSNKIWLNSGSNLKLIPRPTTTSYKTEIQGEAYFEIKLAKTMQFELNAGQEQIVTSDAGFNVNSYVDEPDLRVTALNGSLDIHDERKKNFHLKPGDQAIFLNEQPHIVTGADTAEVVAWKKGIFYFNHNGIAEILRQFARYYDVEIRYPSGIPDRQYLLTLDRNISFFSALSALKSEKLHISLEGREVKVE